MEKFSAFFCASTGTCGCSQVRANRLKRAFLYNCFFPNFA